MLSDPTIVKLIIMGLVGTNVVLLVAVIFLAFKKNTYYEQKDKMQNIFSIRCIIIVFLLYSFTFFLNLINVFIVDTQIFVISYVEMIVALLIYLALLISIGLEKPVTKYLNITVIAVMVTIAGSALTYHAVIIVVIPIIFSSMYADKKLASYAFVITILSIIITTYAGYYNGVCDANMALLTTNKAGALSSMTDIKFIILVVTKEKTEIQGRPIQMSGSMYEKLAWICCDAMVVMMMQES